MTATFVSISNRALTFLGAQPITSLEDDTKEARACNRMYEQSRNQVLRSHNWNFAVKRASLAANTVAPIWEYTNAFDWPSDCLRIIDVNTTQEWVIEGRQIVSDAGAPLQIVYISEVTDPTLFDVLFVETFALRLASDIAYEITASQQVLSNMEELYRRKIADARVVDAQEAQPAAEIDFLESRI
tara:strand:- start:3767 stop:4321 length:555 start_codon:yes stop_codon:yes gene_type:complete